MCEIRTLAIVQARMGSTRLPGKVLMDLGGETVLARVIHRLRKASLLDSIVVATSTSEKNDAVVRECERLQVLSFRGSEHDVLDRYYRCAENHAASAVVRITADCPLIDPGLVDLTIHAFFNNPCDYASNALVPTYPRGLDVEVLTRAALARASSEARNSYEREHVTPYLYEHPELFRLVSVKADANYSQYRWTLDTIEDLKLLRAIYAGFGNRNDFGWREVLQIIQVEPALFCLNAHVMQKAVHA
ncbi:MAG TPA: glycosyltransferase family protein [Terriglobales bacterium]|nr:glycosyltransferase family protein [Terriglobales bacterium]